MKKLFLLIILLTFAGQSYSSELKSELKSNLQFFFKSLTENHSVKDFGVLPEGIEIIEGEGYRGIKLSVSYFELRVDTWGEDIGLLERFNKEKSDNDQLFAAINGTFYSSRGILGQVISDGKIPVWPKQYIAALPRCFLSTFRGLKGYQHWFIGETTVGASVLKTGIFDKVWFNGESSTGTIMDNAIGGGGWILRNRKDVHNESFDRQRFRFKTEDLKARRTVVAQDTDRCIYLLVFETGNSLHQIARTFAHNKVFEKVNDAFFLDGGASSCIVLNGKYLVPPLYLVDKARFSAIQVIKSDLTW
ncbi:MAG: phosphodiester glycosidase family protein [Candidatus Riflebacteria bacterium]|nr:phosphodiester glycosidase family protein [Candidatus Riflebacteria bacterium]